MAGFEREAVGLDGGGHAALRRDGGLLPRRLGPGGRTRGRDLAVLQRCALVLNPALGVGFLSPYTMVGELWRSSPAASSGCRINLYEHRCYACRAAEAVEVFGPELAGAEQFATGTVVGFEGEDVRRRARRWRPGGWSSWARCTAGTQVPPSLHFRGPDGKVYEITQIPDEELRG